MDLRRTMGFCVAVGIMVFSDAALGAPDGWTCPPDWFGDGGCDCGCGVLDSDCFDGTVQACEFCGNFGSCQASPTCAGIDPDMNWLCRETPGEEGPQGSSFVVAPSDPGSFCFFSGFFSDDVSLVLTPGGQASLTCQFRGLPPIGNTLHDRGFPCTLFASGIEVLTSDTQFVRTPSGHAVMTCNGELPPTSHSE